MTVEQVEAKEIQEKSSTNTSTKTAFVKAALIFGTVTVLVLGGHYYWHSRQFEETDDAQIDGNIHPISARVSGHISRVLVQDGQLVKAGDVLAEIDGADYELAIARAKAELADANANAGAARLTVPIMAVNSQSQIQSADADVLHAQAVIGAAQKQETSAEALLVDAKATARKLNADVERYRQLIDKHEIAEQQFDQSVAAAESANAFVTSREASAHGAADQVRQAQTHLTQAHAGVANAQTSPNQVAATKARMEAAFAQADKAKVALDLAQLNLSRTKIVAPIDGIVGKRSAQEGQNVEVGQDLMSVIPLHEIWVTANFKETQLEKMHPGQTVEIEIDMYGGRKWRGHVTSLGGATGARFSILPPENATGNYVKVVQRIPVRVEFDGADTEGFNREGLLRPGMSVSPIVRVR